MLTAWRTSMRFSRRRHCFPSGWQPQILAAILACGLHVALGAHAAPQSGANAAVAAGATAPGTPAPAAPTTATASPDAAVSASQPANATPGDAVSTATEPTGGRPYTSFLELWHARQAALGNGEADVAKEVLGRLVRAKLASGWPDLFVLGEALALDCRDALAAGQGEDALSLGVAAVALAPHRVATHTALARAEWQTGSPFAALRSTWRATVVAAQEPPSLRLHAGMVGLACAAGLLLAIAIFAFGALVRHGRELAHDLLHVLPPGATVWHGGFFVLLVALAPLFFQLGVATSVVLWLLAMSFYFELPERLGATVALCALGIAAAALPYLSAHLAYPNSRAEDCYASMRDAGALDAAQHLVSRPELGADDLWILGLRARWGGDLPEARQWLEQAVSKSKDADLLVSLGNVRYLSDDMPAAIEAYELAAKYDSDHVVASFNLWRAYSALGELQKANLANQRARAIDYDLVERLTEEAKRASGRFIVEPTLPRRLIDPPLVLGAQHFSAVQQAWRVLGGPLPRRGFALMSILVAGLVMLFGWLGTLGHVGRRCSRCGRISCLRCSPSMPSQSQCDECFRTTNSKARIDPQVRVKKEIEVHRYNAARTRTRHVLALLVVGAAQMSRGAALKGLALAMGFWTSCLLVAVSLGYLPPLPVAEQGLGGLAALSTGSLGVACYVLSLVDGLREAD